MVSDETGNVVSRKRFSPYGIEEGTEGDDHSDYGFLGKRVERDAGVSLLGPRAYLPVISRFLSPDPINVDTGGLDVFNRYAYGINNPLKYVDPTGFFAEKSMPSIPDREGLGGKADGDAKGVGAAGAGALSGHMDDELDALFSSKPLKQNSREVAIAPAAWAVVGVVLRYAPKVYKYGKSLLKRESKRPITKKVPEIKWPAQERHFPGHNSYTPGRSMLTSDPTKLAQKAGTGQQVGKIPVGQPGSKERVDFGEKIGVHIDRVGNASPSKKGYNSLL